VPWDTEIFGVAVADLHEIRIDDWDAGENMMRAVSLWCAERDVHLCAARLPQGAMRECLLLQDHGFRVIELHLVPEFSGLAAVEFPRAGFDVEIATEADRDRLVALAGRAFTVGRFHDDPRIGRDLGNRRYSAWMAASFAHPRQDVEKVILHGDMVAVFVTELGTDGTMHWWLTALTEHCIGKGVAKDVWRTMLVHARNRGANRVTTGISSHNVIVHNLYAALGFRFTRPSFSLHWLRKPLSVGAS
jgi:RimJ/RimL family protein N-acetyltransferase